MKVLIMFTGYGIGDIVLLSSYLKKYKEIHPDHILDILVEVPKKEMLRFIPAIRKVYGDSRTIKEYWHLFQEIKAEKYDKCHFFNYTKTKYAYLVALAGIRERVMTLLTPTGRLPKELLMTKRLPRKVGANSLFLSYSRLIDEDIGLDKEFILHPHLEIDREISVEGIENFIKPDKINIAINAGSSKGYKNLSAERLVNREYPYYADLILMLNRYDVNVLLLGTPDQCEDLYENILSRSPDASIINCAKIGLSKSIYLLSKCDAYIGNDSGWLHIASSFESVLSVGIFGPSHTLLFLAKNKLIIKNESLRRIDCYGKLDKEADIYDFHCYKQNDTQCPMGHWRCMKELSPELIADQVMSRLL